MMPNDLAIKTIFRVATYMKSPDWCYENESRIARFKPPNDMGLFTDYKFNSRKPSINLGPLISPVGKNSIVAISAKYPHTRIYGVGIGMSRTFLLDEIHVYPYHRSAGHKYQSFLKLVKSA